MSLGTSFGLSLGARRAHSLTPGSLVLLRASALPNPLPGIAPEAEVVCLNAVRQGKDFINHYLVPLDPLPGPPPGRLDDLTMIYVDFDLPLRAGGEAFSLALTPRPAGPRGPVSCGEVVENPSGRFLKVREPYKGAFSLAYVDLASGEVRRRQEATLTAALHWQLVVSGKDPRQGLMARLRHLAGS